MKINIKTYHFTYSMSHDFNPGGKCLSRLCIEQSLKIIVLYPTPNSIIGLAPGIVASFSLSVVVCHVFFVVMDSIKRNYIYGKQVKAADLTSFKVYIKRTIWIRRISFGKIDKTWNYMLDISNKTQKAKVAKNFGHQFIFLVEKMRNRYLQFFDLV